MKNRRFIVGLLILFFFVLTGGLTSCALFENAAESDLTNAVGLNSENGPGSGNWVPPRPKNRDQCLQLRAIGVSLREEVEKNSSQMEPIRARCVENKAFLPGVDEEACIAEFNKFYEPAQLLLTDFAAGGGRYFESCTSEDEDNTLPPWPLLSEKDEEKEPPNATAVPEATKEPATDDDTWGCCWCLTCIMRLDTEYMMRPIIIEPSG
ncbi:MAG: hypothetical protein KC445_17900 [Anaerolineales bacterium]|nr:hypothetical protein [Anaerolineales bacterium]